MFKKKINSSNWLMFKKWLDNISLVFVILLISQSIFHPLQAGNIEEEKALGEAVYDLRQTGGRECVHNAVKDVVSDILGVQVTGSGSHVKGNYTPGKSDHDFTMKIFGEKDTTTLENKWRQGRKVFKDGIESNAATELEKRIKIKLSKTIEDPQKIDKIIKGMRQEIRGNAKMLANEFASRTNLYPPAQLMEGVTTEAQAAARFKKLGAPPTVLYENGEKLSEKVFQETAEGIYGKGAKSFIQSYEDKAGKVWYKDAKTGKIRKGFVDLVHLKEGYGKYTAEGVASNAQQWALKAEHAMEHGDYRSAFKYTRRIEKDLTKGTDLARLDKVKTRVLKKFVGKLDAIEFMNRGLPPAEKTKAINEAISKLLENPATRRELFQSIREARLQAELLHSFSVTKNPWAKTFIRDTLQESTPAAKKFLGILDKNSLKNVPVGKILMALFVYMDLKDASQKAGRGEDDEAARKLLEGSLFAMGSMGPATAAMVTNIFLDWVKERGFAVSTVTQDCEDLLAQIIEVKGWESADSFGSRGETNIETLALEIIEEKKIRAIVETSIFNAASRGSNTSKINEGKIKPLYSRCSEEIVTKWRNKRAEMAGDYLMSLQKLRELVKASTGIVQIESNPALLLRRKGEDEKSASVDVTAELLSPQLEKILLLAKRVKQKAKLLGGRRNQVSVGFYKNTQWFMDGKKLGNEEKSYNWENPVSKKSLVFDKLGEHNITCEVEWSVHLQSTITEAGTHTTTTIHPLNAIFKYVTIAGIFVDLPVTTTATKRGDVFADNQKFTSFSTKSLLSGKIIINDSDLEDSLKVYIKGLSSVLPSKRIMLMATIESAAKIDMEKLRFVWSKNVEADGLSAFFESSKSGRKIVTVEVYKGKEKMAESHPFHINVVDPSKATFSFEITGPSDVKDKEQDITLHTIINGINGAGKLLLSDKDTWIEWIVDDKVLERGDAVRIGFPSAGKYAVTARLMREVNGQTISLADAMHTVKVEKKMTDESAEKELADDASNKDAKNNNGEKIAQKPDKQVDSKGEADRETEKEWISKIKEAFKDRDCAKMRQIYSKLMLYGKNKIAIGYKYPEAGKLLSKYQAQMAREKEKWFSKDLLGYLRKVRSLIRGQDPYNKSVAEGRRMTDDEEACSRKIVKPERKRYSQIIQEHKKTVKKLFELQGHSVEICDVVDKFVKKYEIPKTLEIAEKYKNICKTEPKDYKFSVEISGSKHISLTSRESVTLEAVIVGGKKPIILSWEGGNISPNGSTAIFAATTAGSYTVQVVAKDADGETKTDAVSIKVKKIDLPSLGGLPNEVYYGTSKVISVEGVADSTSGNGVDCTKNPDSPFCVSTNTDAVKKPCKNPFDEDCRVRVSQESDGGSVGVIMAPADDMEDIAPPASIEEEKEEREVEGVYEYTWQPSGGGLKFDPPSGNSPKVNVTFGNIGDVEIWAEVKKNGKYIGDTKPIKTRVIPPKFTLTASPVSSYVGDEIKATIDVQPNIDNKYLDFRWLDMGDTVQQLGKANEGRTYRLKLKSNKPTILKVLVWAQPYAEEQIANLKYVVSGKPYRVDISKPKRLDKAPWKWDPKQGKAIELPQAIAVFQNAAVHAIITPEPKEKVSYQWSVTPEGCTVSAPFSKSTNLNAHETETYTVTVKASNKNGVELGKGSTSFVVTVSQRDLNVAKQKAKDQKKAKELLQKGRQLWKQGKLKQAIAQVIKAQKNANKDKNIAKTLKTMRKQKEQLDDKLNQSSDLIKQGKLKEADRVISGAANISNKTPKYKQVLQQLANAKRKAEEESRQNKLAEQLQEKANSLWDSGKLSDAITVLKNGSEQIPNNKEIADSLLAMQKQKQKLDRKLQQTGELIKKGKLEEAKKILSDVERINNKYSEYKNILRQFTDAKKKAQEKKEIAARRISVPDLSGKSLSEAKSTLKSLWLRLIVEKSISAPSEQLSGKVKSQRPPAGLAVKKGSVVTIRIYSPYISPYVNVPDLSKKSLSEVRAKLKSLGLRLRIEKGHPAPSEQLSNKVRSQQPPAGLAVKKGSVVALRIYSREKRDSKIKKILSDAKSKWHQNEKRGAIAKLDEILHVDPDQKEAIALKNKWQDILHKPPVVVKPPQESKTEKSEGNIDKVNTDTKGNFPSGTTDNTYSGYWRLIERKGSIGRECTRKDRYRYHDYYRDTISGFGTHVTITNMIRKGNEVYCKHEVEWQQPPEKLYPGTTIKSPVTIKRLAYTGKYGCDMTVSFDSGDMECGFTSAGIGIDSVQQKVKDPKVLNGEVKWKVKDSFFKKAGEKLTIRTCFRNNLCGKPGFRSYYEWVPNGAKSTNLSAEDIDGIEKIDETSEDDATKKAELADKIRKIREAAKKRRLDEVEEGGTKGNDDKSVAIPKAQSTKNIVVTSDENIFPGTARDSLADSYNYVIDGDESHAWARVLFVDPALGDTKGKSLTLILTISKVADAASSNGLIIYHKGMAVGKVGAVTRGQVVEAPLDMSKIEISNSRLELILRATGTDAPYIMSKASGQGAQLKIVSNLSRKTDGTKKAELADKIRKIREEAEKRAKIKKQKELAAKIKAIREAAKERARIQKDRDEGVVPAINSSSRHIKLGSFSGTLTQQSPHANHKIVMPEDGELHIKVTEGPKLGFYCGVRLRDRDNKTQIGGNCIGLSFSVAMLRAGVYYLDLTKDGREFYYGPYSVDVSMDTQKFANDKEPNDAFEKAGVIGLNQTIQGHLGGNWQRKKIDLLDYWRVTIPKSGKMEIAVSTSENLNLYGGITVYNSDKKSISRIYIQGPDSSKKYLIDKIEPGIFYIIIEKDHRDFYWGSYQLRVSLILKDGSRVKSVSDKLDRENMDNSVDNQNNKVIKISKITSPIKAKYGPPPSANKWKHYSIPLTASSFGIDKQMFRQVMSNISSFRIATEMHDGNDIGSIDSVHIGNRYISNFSTGADGWNAAGDGTMHWLSSGGSSGGYLQISDWASGEEHYAVAPASWSGNWEELIGSNIEFYYKTDHPSYSAVVEISSKQQNRLGLIAKPIIIPQGGSTLISISPYPVSSTDLVISLSSSNTNCSEIQNSVVIPAGKKNIETKVNAIQGATDCDSVITATTSTYGESRITLSVGKKASNSPIDTGDTGKSSVITSGITKTSTNYTPNTKGDVFKGGHWAGASGQSDWIQKDFGSVRLVTGIYIGRASTDITTQGFKLVLKLQQTNGQWITIDELHNTNINRTALSGGAIGKSISPYSKKLSPAIKATAFRLEFSGHGWFDATDIRIYSQQENSIGFTLGFETGKTNGWVKTGTAFDYQPTYGDNPTARHRGQPSKHIGNYWIGTYEKYQGRVAERLGSIQGDGPKGTLTSKKFTIPSGSLSFLVGGGSSFQTRVELLVSGNKVLHVSGKNTESMHRVEWNLTPWAGQKGQIKVVDNASGGWGHINVDDFKFSGSTWFTEK